MPDSRIAVDTSIHFGQPCIQNTRIPVHSVLELIEAGVTFEEIISQYYPEITVEDIKACIRYTAPLSSTES